MDSNDQPQERVVIEDYRGPASQLPPPAPANAQITAETKQQPGAVSQTAPTSLDRDWPMTLATTGALLGIGVVGWLCVFIISTSFHQNLNSHILLHVIIDSFVGAFIVGIAIIGFILCATSLFHYHTSQRPAAVLSRSRVGLVLSILALLVVLFG